jgi:hypothetical protein
MDTAKQVLVNSADKGSFLKQKLFGPAWSPVLSLESVNGETWRDLKSKFIIFQKHLPPLDKLILSTRNILAASDQNIEIDADQIVHLTVACFVKWIFNLNWNPEWNFVYEVSWEWRKEIAAKRKADPKMKRKTVD